jgi:hypothetical protein
VFRRFVVRRQIVGWIDAELFRAGFGIGGGPPFRHAQLFANAVPEFALGDLVLAATPTSGRAPSVLGSEPIGVGRPPRLEGVTKGFGIFVGRDRLDGWKRKNVNCGPRGEGLEDLLRFHVDDPDMARGCFAVPVVEHAVA